MPELFTILIKINVALVLFCLGYYLVLRKLTFYTLNRAYLVTAILFSSIYPFIDFSVFAQRHQEIIAPVQNVVIIWKAPAENFVKQAAYWNWLEIIFWVGAAVFSARLLLQLTSLYKIYKKSVATNINGQKVRVVSGNISPFSFWQSIYVNPDQLDPTDLKNILEHEQVHVNQWHTLDILLTEISVIFYWFNPGIWIMKRAVRENIEFITDRKILQKGMDSKAYQYSLLNVTFSGHGATTLTNNFNFSTLKKRIVMMNAKRSSNANLSRYAFLVPLVVLCLFVFSLSKAEAVKISPVYKTIAATVENISGINLNADTTPVKKNTTRTIIESNNDANSVIITKGGGVQTKVSTVILTRDTSKNSTVTARSFNLADSVTIIVNNKVITTGIESIDPYTIETVSVLKDNAQGFLAERMGSDAPSVRDSKGVIYITTKTDGVVTHRPSSNSVEVVGYGVQKPDTTSLGRQIRLKRTDTKNPPLIVVDGVPLPLDTDESALDKIDQNSIKSFTVLKGASAANIYGEKGKNGAIIITTKNANK